MDKGINTVTKIATLCVVLSTLFLFGTFTTEYFETPKLLILSLFVAILLVLWAVRSIVSGQLLLTLTPFDLPLVLFLSVATVSTILSPSPNLSLFGNLVKVNGTLLSFIIYILFYFLVVNNLKSAKDTKAIINLLLLGGVVLSIISLLYYFGIKFLSLEFIKGVNFTPTGSVFSTTALLSLLLPFPLLAILNENNLNNKLLNSLILIIFGTTAVLIGSPVIWIVGALTLCLVFATSNSAKLLKNLPFLSLPLIISVTVALFSYLPALGKVDFNPFFNPAQNFPREVTLGFVPSWKVSVSSFRDSPFWGTGPGTYQFNYTAYKPVDVNKTKFWGIRFDSAFNEYLQVLGVLGGLGLLALLILTAIFIKSSFGALTSIPNLSEAYFNKALAISGLILFILLALHSATLVVWVVGLLILACFAVAGGRSKPIHLKLGAHRSGENLSVDILPGILIMLVLGLVGFAAFNVGKISLADFYHRQALNAVNANKAQQAYDELVKSAQYNPLNDLYRTDLAQTNIALANAIVASKVDPSASSPSANLSETDKETIKTLIQQSINHGKAATILSPRSAANWEVLGSVYRQISGVAQNSLQFALDGYGRAIQRDPLNPNLRITVGSIYYSVKNYDLAIRFFTDAINLKPDLNIAYYNLSIALKDKGDLETAKKVAEKLVSILEVDSPDYKKATEFLDQLNQQISTGQTSKSTETDESALEKKNLPKVLDLEKPANIATPPAVKKSEE